VKAVRDDAIIATGRTDYPNQVNNVLCFPYIFRGALDVGATTVNDAMEDCLRAFHRPHGACAEQTESTAYAANLSLRPRLHDPQGARPAPDHGNRPAVAKAAGIGCRHPPDRRSGRLPPEAVEYVYASAFIMKPVFAQAKRAQPKRIAYCRRRGRACAARRADRGGRRPGRPILIGRAGGDRPRASRSLRAAAEPRGWTTTS
jgi:malate dehydrogenase (oxaloacetate-decarboxylating)(NADP+)